MDPTEKRRDSAVLRAITTRPPPSRDPMTEGPAGIVNRGVENLVIDKTPDFFAAERGQRVGRMIAENFATVGEYVASIMEEFQDASRCRIYVVPKNTFGDNMTTVLEHRLTVARSMNGTAVEETGSAIRHTLDPIFVSFMNRQPLLIDDSTGLKLRFDSLDMNSDSGEVSPVPIKGGGFAVMPWYYREPEHPSGVVVFEGDLSCRGSKLEGFAKSYWTSKLSMLSAVQIGYQLTHRFDAITTLAKGVDFNVDLKDSIRQVLRHDMSNVYLLLIDLDDFKRVNEEHNYRTGNEVLGKVAEMINASIRSNDVASRFGGEEFGVILRGMSSMKEALAIGERIRTNIASLRIPSLARPGQLVRITCSIGVTNVDQIAKVAGVGDHSEQVIESVRTKAFDTTNALLKSAKLSGKNCMLVN